MPLINNDRMEELALVAHDRLSSMDRRWWKALMFAAIASVPLFFILKYSFFALIVGNYQPPAIVADRPIPQPLTVIDRGIFELDSGSYAGFVRIRNINLDRGAAELNYNVKYKTAGNTLVTEISGRTFILPASEKILSFPRFTSERRPELVEFSFEEPRFLYKPQLPQINLNVERVQFQRENGNLYVSVGVKNLSPFTIRQIYLPILLYDSANKIVGVNSTFINEVRSSEIRTFRFVWPTLVPSAVRAEVHPEINIFDREIFTLEPGTVQLFSQPDERLDN